MCAASSRSTTHVTFYNPSYSVRYFTPVTPERRARRKYIAVLRAHWFFSMQPVYVLPGGGRKARTEDPARAARELRHPHDEHLVAPRRRVWPVASHLDLRLRQGACRSACNPTASAPRMTHDACRACCAAGTEAPLHDPLREARCVGCAVQGGGDRDASALASLHGVRSDGTLYSLQERIALWRQRSGRALRARPRIMRGRPAQR